jgi:hypothetical protein
MIEELPELVFEEEPHIYRLGDTVLTSVTQLLKAGGLSEDFDWIPRVILDHARERGNMVHLACALLDQGVLDWTTVDPVILPFVRAYYNFLIECRVSWIEIEKASASPLGFAMRPDRIGFVNGRRAVVDLKTGQRMSRSVGVQTSGYKSGWESLHPEEPIAARYGLQLKADGTYQLRYCGEIADESAFGDCLRHHQSEERMNKWRTFYGFRNNDSTAEDGSYGVSRESLPEQSVNA